ncbi:MAG TPA: RidA family protein [Gammaproteobacteria bacterium]|nr:RidA family protein [Gammaproteobacteria bacterium]
MKLIETVNAPLPAGHYSQAVVSQGLVFVSGILPLTPNKDQFIPEGIIAQTEQVFKNLAAILQASDSDMNHLVSVQIFVADLALWGEINRVYQTILGAHKPARTVIPCGCALHYDALLEINAIAEVIKQ